MLRGEIRLVDLEPAHPGAANKRRPAVIVSNDHANTVAARLGRGVITVVPVTSNIAKVFPFGAATGPRDRNPNGLQGSGRAGPDSVGRTSRRRARTTPRTIDQATRRCAPAASPTVKSCPSGRPAAATLVRTRDRRAADRRGRRRRRRPIRRASRLTCLRTRCESVASSRSLWGGGRPPSGVDRVRGRRCRRRFRASGSSLLKRASRKNSATPTTKPWASQTSHRGVAGDERHDHHHQRRGGWFGLV